MCQKMFYDILDKIQLFKFSEYLLMANHCDRGKWVNKSWYCFLADNNKKSKTCEKAKYCKSDIKEENKSYTGHGR